MNTAVVNIKIQPETKIKAQEVASKLGLSLSAFIKSLINQAIKTEKIELSLTEEPSPWMIKMLKESKKDIQAGSYVSFANADEEITYLQKLISHDKKSK